MRIISPSLLSADFVRLEEQIKQVEGAGATRLHLDIMDGHFVPNLTFGPFIVEAIRRIAGSHLDSHLMINHPHRYLQQFVDAGSDSVIIHLEASEDLHRDLAIIRDLGATPGVAINPDTYFTVLQPFLGEFDYLLVMSVYPGFGGQAFIDSSIRNIHAAVSARKDHDFLIAVDGGVNLATIERVYEAGIDIAVVGSGLFEAEDIPRRFRELQG